MKNLCIDLREHATKITKKKSKIMLYMQQLCKNYVIYT